MSTNKSKDELIQHKNETLHELNNFIQRKINGSSIEKGKADKFCYWIKDYIRFLNYENTFRDKCKQKKARRYKRGEILKVHLGYNIGSEEGGLHYCVVITKNDNPSNPVLTVIPLTSVKEHTNITKLPYGSLSLGDDLYTATEAKITFQIDSLTKQMVDIQMEYNEFKDNDIESLNRISAKLELVRINLDNCKKAQKEFDKMKRGSIALVNQITTISKIRIVDPKTSTDPLAGIKLSVDNLELIDKMIIQNYTK